VPELGIRVDEGVTLIVCEALLDGDGLGVSICEELCELLELGA
jgi:hypothetical protein